MPLKEKFIIPQSFPRNVRHTMPRRATEGSTRVRRQEQEGRKTGALGGKKDSGYRIFGNHNRAHENYSSYSSKFIDLDI